MPDPALAPIVLLVYNRPQHTRRTLEALMANALAGSSQLYIYADGPKDSAGKEQLDKILQVRQLLREKQWCKKVEIIESDVNRGLATSVIAGVTDVVNRHGRVIVLEDDLVTSPYFLKYMNEAPSLYADETDVISISGYCYPIAVRSAETFFIKTADCWGWGTWARGWKLFNPDGNYLKEQIVQNNLSAEFDYGSAYPFLEMLDYQVKGLNDSWAIRWYASAFLNNKLTLYPGRSLVFNIGNDKSGQHSGQSAMYDTRLSASPVQVLKIEISENKKLRDKMSRYFVRTGRNQKLAGIKNRLYQKLRQLGAKRALGNKTSEK